MIRVDPADWTADFRIARALAEAYFASGRSDVLFLCFGDPKDTVGRLGPIVGDETRKYYPNVLGTSGEPLTAETIPALAEEVRKAGQGKFLVAIEAGSGPLEHLGSVEITDREPRALAPLGEGAWRFGGVTVSVVLIPSGSAADAGGEAGASPGEGEPPSEGLRRAAMEVGSDVGGGWAGRKRFKPLRPDQIHARTVQKLADTVIDGNLRFLSKIGKQEI